jgi:glycosyl transferase family 25
MWPSYVINLARNTQRMDNSARQLDAAGLPWERIEAVNGWDLPEAEVRGSTTPAATPAMASSRSCPPRSAATSAISPRGSASRRAPPGGFIFEDDFAADDTLGEKLALLSQPQDDWDMVKLFSFDADAPLEWDKPLGHYRIGMPYRVPTCLIGYGLTRDAAAHLAGRARPFFRPVDEDQKFVWETGLRVALILPPPILVGDQSTVTGTIGNERRDARAARGALARGLHNLRYSLRYSWNLARHRRKERRNSAGGGS